MLPDRYVKLNGITVDDPVGAYLFKKFQERPHAKIRLSSRNITYETALDSLESGKMSHEEYDEILKRVSRKSLTVQREELRTSPILKSKLVNEVFGDLDSLDPELMERLKASAYSISSFKEFLIPYLDTNREEVTKRLEFWVDTLIETTREHQIGAVALECERFRNVLTNQISFYHKEYLERPENKEYYETYRTTSHTGGIFALSRIHKDLEGKTR